MKGARVVSVNPFALQLDRSQYSRSCRHSRSKEYSECDETYARSLLTTVCRSVNGSGGIGALYVARARDEPWRHRRADRLDPAQVRRAV